MIDNKVPCWLVWKLRDDGKLCLLAVDTSLKLAEAHRRACDAEAKLLDKPKPRVFLEESRLDHMYGESIR